MKVDKSAMDIAPNEEKAKRIKHYINNSTSPEEIEIINCCSDINKLISEDEGSVDDESGIDADRLSFLLRINHSRWPRTRWVWDEKKIEKLLEDKDKLPFQDLCTLANLRWIDMEMEGTGFAAFKKLMELKEKDEVPQNGWIELLRKTNGKMIFPADLVSDVLCTNSTAGSNPHGDLKCLIENISELGLEFQKTQNTGNTTTGLHIENIMGKIKKIAGIKGKTTNQNTELLGKIWRKIIQPKSVNGHKQWTETTNALHVTNEKNDTLFLLEVIEYIFLNHTTGGWEETDKSSLKKLQTQYNQITSSSENKYPYDSLATELEKKIFDSNLGYVFAYPSSDDNLCNLKSQTEKGSEGNLFELISVFSNNNLVFDKEWVDNSLNVVDINDTEQQNAFFHVKLAMNSFRSSLNTANQLRRRLFSGAHGIKDGMRDMPIEAKDAAIGFMASPALYLGWSSPGKIAAVDSSKHVLPPWLHTLQICVDSIGSVGGNNSKGMRDQINLNLAKAHLTNLLSLWKEWDTEDNKNSTRAQRHMIKMNQESRDLMGLLLIMNILVEFLRVDPDDKRVINRKIRENSKLPLTREDVAKGFYEENRENIFNNALDTSVELIPSLCDYRHVTIIDPHKKKDPGGRYASTSPAFANVLRQLIINAQESRPKWISIRLWPSRVRGLAKEVDSAHNTNLYPSYKAYVSKTNGEDNDKSSKVIHLPLQYWPKTTTENEGQNGDFQENDLFLFEMEVANSMDREGNDGGSGGLGLEMITEMGAMLTPLLRPPRLCDYRGIDLNAEYDENSNGTSKDSDSKKAFVVRLDFVAALPDYIPNKEKISAEVARVIVYDSHSETRFETVRNKMAGKENANLFYHLESGNQVDNYVTNKVQPAVLVLHISDCASQEDTEAWGGLLSKQYHVLKQLKGIIFISGGTRSFDANPNYIPLVKTCLVRYKKKLQPLKEACEQGKYSDDSNVWFTKCTVDLINTENPLTYLDEIDSCLVVQGRISNAANSWKTPEEDKKSTEEPLPVESTDKESSGIENMKKSEKDGQSIEIPLPVESADKESSGIENVKKTEEGKQSTEILLPVESTEKKQNGIENMKKSEKDGQSIEIPLPVESTDTERIDNINNGFDKIFGRWTHSFSGKTFINGLLGEYTKQKKEAQQFAWSFFNSMVDRLQASKYISFTVPLVKIPEINNKTQITEQEIAQFKFPFRDKQHYRLLICKPDEDMYASLIKQLLKLIDSVFDYHKKKSYIEMASTFAVIDDLIITTYMMIPNDKIEKANQGFNELMELALIDVVFADNESFQQKAEEIKEHLKALNK